MTKKLLRKCLVCRKKIRITVYKNKHYEGGHYFNKIEVPIKGTGIYKKIKTTKMLGMKVNVVKWTGKKKNVEYWECNSCYDEAQNEGWLENTLEKLYGKRCPDFNKDCGCCQAWDIYDSIIEENNKGSK